MSTTTQESPRLITLCGLPGAGKSRLAAALARISGATVVSRDALRQVLDPQWQEPAAQAAAFNQLCDTVERVLAAGQTVIAEGMPFSRRSERDRLRAIANRHAATFHLLWLDCPTFVAQQRIAADDHPAHDRDAFAVAARFEIPTEAEGRHRLAADTDPKVVLELALRSLAWRA